MVPVEVGLPVAAVPPAAVPEPGVLSATSTRSSWSSSVAVVICLCSASVITRLIGSSAPWLEGPIDPSSTKNVIASAAEASTRNSASLSRKTNLRTPIANAPGGRERRVAFLRETRAHLRAWGCGPCPLGGTAVAQRRRWRPGSGCGSIWGCVSSSSMSYRCAYPPLRTRSAPGRSARAPKAAS